MSSAGTRAILEVLKRDRDEVIEPGVLRIFGASSIDECIATYEVVGAGERSSIDDALRGVFAKASPALLRAAETIHVPPPKERPAAANYDDLEREYQPAPSSPSPSPRTGPPLQSYRLRRQILSLGRSYYAEDPSGERVFRIAGRIGFARVFSVKDASGNALYTAREKLLVLDPTFIISRDGAEAAVVRRTTTSGAPDDKFEITLQSGDVLHGIGKIWTEEGVRITRNGSLVANVRRQQYVVRETELIEVLSSADQALFLAIAMSIVEIDPSRGQR